MEEKDKDGQLVRTHTVLIYRRRRWRQNVWGDVNRLPATLLDIHSKSEMVGGAGDGKALEEQEDKRASKYEERLKSCR